MQIRIKGLHPISRSFAKKKDAQHFARQVEGDGEIARKLGQPVSTCITFRELADEYLAQYAGNDPSTQGRIEFWCSHFGAKVVTQIDVMGSTLHHRCAVPDGFEPLTGGRRTAALLDRRMLPPRRTKPPQRRSNPI